MENRPGAGGNIGAHAVAVAKPDGYTMLLGFDGTMVINPHVYENVSFDTLKDFAPIGKICDIDLVLVANPALGAKTISDVVALSKKESGGISVGASGTGSTAHLLLELLKQQTGANRSTFPTKAPVPRSSR